MKSILVHRYRPFLAASAGALLAALTGPLASASDDPFSAPGAAAAILRTPVTSLGDDGKDIKEVKTVKPEETSPLFDVLLNVQFSDKYITPRGQIVRDRGLTIQPLALIFLNAYKGEGFINNFTIVGGGWWDFGTSLVSKRAATPYPKTNWSEFDPIAGISVGFAKRFKLDVTYTAFVERYHDIETSNHLETKLTFDDSDFLKDFALHPYVSYWQELWGKATAADVGEAVLGPNPNSGKHPQPFSSFYFEIGVDPSYTFKNFGDLKFEAPCHIQLVDDRFYGNYFGKTSTLALWEVGLKASVPLKFIKGFGHWSVYAGVNYFSFEDVNLRDMQVFNDPGKAVQATWQAYGGISVFFLEKLLLG